jgi:hypothetical protein
MNPADVTQELLESLLDYDHATGDLTWKTRFPSMFKRGKQSVEHSCAIWNTKFAGKAALSSSSNQGYRQGHLNYRQVLAHRMIWVMFYNEWPEQIDHINGIRTDNRLANLRAVTLAENNRNQKMRNTNSSGICGVRATSSGRWLASIRAYGKQTHLGTFDTIEQAAYVRGEASKRYGFHENHGKVRR